MGTRYTYNSANQRVQSGSAADGSSWVYQYDALGQVTSGRRFWPDRTPVEGQQFEYAFDQIGNRTGDQTSGGDAAGSNLRVTTYPPADSLNRYPSRTTPRYLEVQGGARANGQAPGRYGEYFRRELSIAGTGPVWQNVDVAVTGGTSLLGKRLFVPPQTETFAYDLDGNLTQDGRWDYVWDAENRLVEVRTTVTTFNAGVLGQKVTYEYDWQGRLVKRSTDTGTPPSSWTAGPVPQYLYDGWNCVAEFDGAGTWQRVNLWGTDLSGSRTGAGGVGGLLAVKSAANGTHFTTYDGNGNILGLDNAADGVCSARYEDDPFGNTLRVSGSARAAENLWRFSTKRGDTVTDLVHCEYRVYSPQVGRWLGRDKIEESVGRVRKIDVWLRKRLRYVLRNRGCQRSPQPWSRSSAYFDAGTTP